MLTPNTIEKLKKLEISLEISLTDELSTNIIIEKSLDKLMEMHNEGFIDSTERFFILKTLKEIIYEEESFAKMLQGNCVVLLDNINKTAKTIELLGK